MNQSRSPKEVMWVALIGVAATSFPITVLSATLSNIGDEFGTSDATTAWVIAAPLLAFAVFTPLAGKLGDLHGHRRLYLIGFAASAVLSVATAFAWDIGSLIVLRTLAQSAAAATGPSALAIMFSVFKRSERTRVAGTWSAVISASPAVGVVIGGPLIDLTSWRVLFIIQGIGSAIAVLAAVRVLPETVKQKNLKFDLTGGLVLGVAVGTLLFSLNRAGAWGWSNPYILMGLVIAPVALALFVAIETRIDQPLVSLPIIRQRNVAAPLVTQLFLNGPYMAGLVLTSFLLGSKNGFAYSTTIIAFAILPRPAAFSIASALSDRAERRFGGRLVVVGGMSFIAMALALIGIGAAQQSIVIVLIGITVSGIGSGISRPPLISALTNALPDVDLGIGTGLLNMVSQIGAAAGISLLSALVADSSTGADFRTVFLVAAAAALAGVISGSMVRYPPRRAHGEPTDETQYEWIPSPDLRPTLPAATRSSSTLGGS